MGQRRAEEKEWCMDQADWANGLNVFYIHSDAISKDAKSGNKGYMESSSMTLKAGESKTLQTKRKIAGIFSGGWL